MEARKESSSSLQSGDLSSLQDVPIKGKLKVRIVNNVVLLVVLAIGLSLFVTGGFVNTGYIWIFVFLAFVFLLSSEDVKYWVLLLVLALSVSVGLHGLGLLVLPYSFEVIINFFFSLLFFIGFMLFFQYRKEAQEGLLRRRMEYLKNEKLVQGFLQARALELERTKIAMTRMTKDVLAERDRLEKERAKANAILYSIGEGLFAVDLEGAVVMVNFAAEELLEIKEEEALGKQVCVLFNFYDEEENVVPEEKLSIYTTLRTAEEINKIYFYKRKDGNKLCLSVNTTPIKQRDKIIGAIGVLRDVTKDKEADRIKQIL